MRINRSSLARRGSGLEATVIASQRGVIRVVKLPTGCRFVGPKALPIKGPVDYAGVVTATGRGLFFDAKETASKSSFSLHPSHCPPHQLEFLRMMGGGNALAGLLIQSQHLQQYLWLDWSDFPPLMSAETTIKWGDPRLHVLGDSRLLVKFELIPGFDRATTFPRAA